MKHVIFKYAWKNVSRRLRITGSLLICVFLSVFSIVLAWGTYDAIDSGIEPVSYTHLDVYKRQL